MEATTTPTRTREAGQHGSLRLSFERREARTVLAGRYSRSPFGAVRAGYPDGSGIPEVQITNPSGGTLGGDRLDLEVSLAPGSSATVLTQAANKAYRGDAAEQRAVLSVGDGAFLEHLPHHLIPYSGSDYRQETTFDLAPDATLITWDACAAGRVARGERFAFTSLRSRTRISRDGLPEVIDGFDLTGGAERFSGYSYAAAAYVLAPKELGPLADELHDLLSGIPRTLASASAPSPGLCAIRALTTDAHALYRILNQSRDLARAFLEMPVPAREIS
jgi:urease accessory protein